MSRFQFVTQAAFDDQPLSLVTAVRVGRSANPRLAGSDAGPFITSVELDRPVISAELDCRDLEAAEMLELGRRGTLEFTTLPASAGQAQRRVRLLGAVLHAVELVYEQATPARAVLRFLAESDDANTQPFLAEEVSP